MSTSSRPALQVFAVSLPLSLVACAWLVTETAKATIPSNQIVKVRGVADQTLVADRVNWRISVRVLHKERNTAFAEVDHAVDEVVAYLKANGVKTHALQMSAHRQHEKNERVTLDKWGNQRVDFVGYVVNRDVVLQGSSQLDLVEKLHLQLTNDLVRKGLPVEADTPYYFVSKDASVLKPELLRQAAQNAFQRASIVAESSGSKLGGLRAARQGAFEGLDSNGRVGGSQRQHQVRAIVTTDFSIAR